MPYTALDHALFQIRLVVGLELTDKTQNKKPHLKLIIPIWNNSFHNDETYHFVSDNLRGFQNITVNVLHTMAMKKLMRKVLQLLSLAINFVFSLSLYQFSFFKYCTF